MKSKTFKFINFAVLFLTFNATAGEVAGYYRSNGTYVRPHYRSTSSTSGATSTKVNPNANPYTIQLNSYKKNNGTVVFAHERTRANHTIKDNLRYR